MSGTKNGATKNSHNKNEWNEKGKSFKAEINIVRISSLFSA